MRVLIACETSGRVRDAFIAAGHNAWSCDLLPSDQPTYRHLQQDVETLLAPGMWDLIVMHPPCTALSVSGNAHYAKGKPKYAERIQSIEWTLALWQRACEVCPRVALENPVGVLPIPATQYVQPWQFGEPESKRTGLWLHGLPLLAETNRLPPPASGRWENQTPSGQNKLGPSADRWKVRSRTYQGIADAMASQWGAHE